MRSDLQLASRIRRVVAGGRLLVGLVALSLLTGQLHAQPAEYEVKAAFLLNFAKFVDWSEADIPHEGPFTVCIVGDDPFGLTMDQIVEGETVGDRKIVVQRLRSISETTCHIAFLSKSLKEPAKILVEIPEGVLTVGEGDSFLRDGGMIAFVLEKKRVRFDITTTAIRNAGLRVSSRLLTVARTVQK